MKKEKSDSTSRFISLILRHKPETIGITLDEHGWADVRELIDGINRSGGHDLNMDSLEEIVRSDEKQRYSFNEDHTLIRANQGHSIPVDVELEKKPHLTFYGTVRARSMSLLLMSRDLFRRAASMCIFPLTLRQRGKLAVDTESRSFMKLTVRRCQMTDIPFSNRQTMSG